MNTIRDPHSQWLACHGPIVHREDTRERIAAPGEKLIGNGRVTDTGRFQAMLANALTGWQLSALCDYTYLEDE